MRITVFGAGAVGGHLAARLARAGAQVSLVARGPHLEAIRAHGLRLVGVDEDFTVPVRAAADARELGPQDLVVTSVKAHALPAAVDGIAALLGPDTPVVYAANGIPWWYFHRHGSEHAERRLPRLDPDGRLWDVLGPQRAIGCVVQSPNEVVEPGVVRNGTADNVFTLGEPAGGVSARLAAVAEALGRGVPGVRTSDRIRHEIWRKLLLNMSLSPLACLTLSTGADVAEDAELRAIFARLSEEGSRVAAALGEQVALDVEAWLARSARIRHRSSMLQDLEAGRPMEIDGQLAVVRDIARTLAVPTPVLDLLLPLLIRRARATGLYPAPGQAA
ncbi:2-dehydropantoate 2-reductase [Verticiella sediminum]|uniref:2-dehydropantoate 2-reductase n=1 Tax=Verticiella sediminum TaxID=1247510 RepID=A0A556ACW9_9BURK|nr:2-dehydropantoate 2-reductase [Verticiella sediminum]TSH90727.1 2-dehydropantoate 2-reductase [Verticiella sediminum]